VPAAAGCRAGEGPGEKAEKAVAAVVGAHTDEQRASSIENLLKEMGVATVADHAVEMAALSPPEQPGPASLADLRRYEVSALGRALGRGKTVPLPDLAEWLNGFGPDPAFQADDLKVILRSSIEESLADRDSRASLIPLLIHHLGLAHDPPEDLSVASGGPIHLDPLQLYLIQADLGVTVSRELAADVPAVAVQAPDEWGRVGRKISRFYGLGPKTILKNVIKAGIRGSIIAYSVGYFVSQSPVETHYGHGTEKPGKRVRIGFQVRMIDDFPIRTIPSIGAIPPPGPISGVPVEWPELGHLSSHGDVIYSEASNVTNDNGEAWIEFQPRQEDKPFVGMTLVDTGVVWARVNIQAHIGSTLGRFTDFLAPTPPMIRWFVGRHEPPGYLIEFPPVVWSTPVAPHDHSGTGVHVHTEKWTAQTCTADLTRAVWTFTRTVTRDAIPDNPAYRLAETASGQMTGHLSESAPFVTVDHLENATFNYEYALLWRRHFGMNVRIVLTGGDPPRAELTMSTVEDHRYLPGPRTVSGNLVGNPACPTTQ
jgi:hypothetical protein